MSSERKTNVPAFQQHLFKEFFSSNKYLASYFEMRAYTHDFFNLKYPEPD